jgi:hypothetical protein
MADIFLTGIPSAELFGGVAQSQEGTIGAILSEEAFGELRGVKNLTLTGIGTSQAFGTLRYSSRLNLIGIDSSEAFGNLTGEVAFAPPTFAITHHTRSLSIPERLSAPIITQNVTPTDTTSITSYDSSNYNIYQDFFLPDDYVRGVTCSKIPPLTGLQVLADIATGYEDVAAIDWTLQYEDDGWVDLTSGTTVGVTESGTQVWLTAYFPQPVEISDDLLTTQFRFGVRGRDYSEVVKQEISDTRPFVINDEEFDVYLPPGTFHHLLIDGVPSVLHRDFDTEKVYYSQEYGVTNVYSSADSSLLFRILGGIADEGTDFLGNAYRNVVTTKPLSNVDPLDSTNENAYWLSKPNPSQFATESLYFDITKDNDLTTVDHILLDPVTPGIYFNVYFSSDGEAGITKTDWENKLWTPVASTFRAQQRLTHPMPIPITAKYIKLEFTQLQPRWYAPGDFQKEILYDKFPKWVLDYYLLALNAGTVNPNTEDPFIARTLSLSTDALALAYTYYLDDLRDQPLTPRELIQDPTNFNSFLQQRNSLSDQVDPQTFARIKMAFQPFTTQPGLIAATDQLLNLYTGASGGYLKTGNLIMRPDYPVETLFEFQKNINPLVSTLERDPLLVEKEMPVMKFFITARHRYRQVKAKLENDKAYFAGVNEIAFLRDDYSVPFDRDMIVEVAGDSANVARNDFAHTGSELAVTND